MRAMPLNPDMRAADSDRDRVSEALREHCAQGRITMDELNERLDRTYAAKTLGDLQAVTADLPEHDLYDWPIPAARRSELAPQQGPVLVRRAASGGLRARVVAGAWAAYVSVNAICLGIWLVVLLAGGGLQGLWPLWVAGPWGVFLVLTTLAGTRRHGGTGD